jgi:hypothetical protein
MADDWIDGKPDPGLGPNSGDNWIDGKPDPILEPTGGDLSASLQETLRVTEFASGPLLAALLTEHLRVSDTALVVQPVELFAFIASEHVTVSDALVVQPIFLSVSLTETIRIRDTPTTHIFQGKIHLSQEPIEVLDDDGETPFIHLSQEPLESLVDDGIEPVVHLSQIPIEVLVEVVTQCISGGQVPVLDDPPDGQPFVGRNLNPRLWLEIDFDD